MCQGIIDSQTDPWAMKVSAVKIMAVADCAKRANDQAARSRARTPCQDPQGHAPRSSRRKSAGDPKNRPRPSSYDRLTVGRRSRMVSLQKPALPINEFRNPRMRGSFNSLPNEGRNTVATTTPAGSCPCRLLRAVCKESEAPRFIPGTPTPHYRPQVRGSGCWSPDPV